MCHDYPLWLEARPRMVRFEVRKTQMAECLPPTGLATSTYRSIATIDLPIYRLIEA
jgi:hypothetical protein